MIDQSRYNELSLDLDDVNAELRWRQMSDYGRKEHPSFGPKRRWSNREIRALKTEIERLPAIKATLRDVSPGTEVALGALRRYYVNLTFERPDGWQRKSFADVGIHGAATSLAQYMRGVEVIEAGSCSAVDIARHAAAASSLEAQEYGLLDRYTEKPLDFTTNELRIRMSLAAFALVEPVLQDALVWSASRPEIVVILSADVDSRLSLARRHLEVGQGQTFERITSGPFQPVRWHLHVFEPPPWPVAGWRTERKWLPNDCALDHPVRSWVIEEFSDGLSDDAGSGLLSRTKALWLRLSQRVG